MKFHHAAALALVACLVPMNVFAKCGASAIRIEGVISGPAAGSTVSVQVVPDSNYWIPEPATVVDANGRFHGTVYFDRYEPGTWLTNLYSWERCSRKPETITVQLHRNGQLVDQVPLQFSEDFVNKDDSRFSLRSPITLHSR